MCWVGFGSSETWCFCNIVFPPFSFLLLGPTKQQQQKYYLFLLGANMEVSNEHLTIWDTRFLLRFEWSSVSISRDSLPGKVVNQNFTVFQESLGRQDVNGAAGNHRPCYNCTLGTWKGEGAFDSLLSHIFPLFGQQELGCVLPAFHPGPVLSAGPSV